MWDEEKELLWSSLPDDEAFKQACITSVPILKERMDLFFSRALEDDTSDVIALCWDASSMGIAIFKPPPRISIALWNLGCSVPALVNLQSQEEAQASARSVMLQVLANNCLLGKRQAVAPPWQCFR